jgi:hypothetical protein
MGRQRKSTMLRAAHGNGAAAVVRVEQHPVDELPQGEPRPVTAPGPKRVYGRPFQPKNAYASLGGKTLHGRARLASQLGLTNVTVDPRFRPYRASAEGFRKAECSRLALLVGYGQCGPGPSSLVASTALQLAASRFAFEVLGDMLLGSRLANDAKQTLLAAHELAAREGEALKRTRPAGHDRLAAAVAARQPVPARGASTDFGNGAAGFSGPLGGTAPGPTSPTTEEHDP